MRHGQGSKAKPVMDKLKREMVKALRELQRMEPGTATQKNEPNDYGDILAARPRGPRRLWEKLESKGLADRMKGAWLGRA